MGLPGAFGAGESGTAGAAGAGVRGTADLPVAGAGAPRVGAGRNCSSRTDFGAVPRTERIDNRSDRKRKIPPLHQLDFVRRFAAWRVPTNESDDDAAPPKLAASPPPFPD